MTKPANESIAYSEMMQNVEAIIRNLSQPGVDLDKMISQVEQGYELIQAMRQRLDVSKEKIEKLIQENSSN